MELRIKEACDLWGFAVVNSTLPTTTHYRNTTCAIGTHLTPEQWTQLCEKYDCCIYLAFDQDNNQAGQKAAKTLARRLHQVGLTARFVLLPAGQDPNTYFAAGATADDFARCLEEAPEL